jgi:hypothetical protein
MVAEVRAALASAMMVASRWGGRSSGGGVRPKIGGGSGARVWRGESGTAAAHGKRAVAEVTHATKKLAVAAALATVVRG